MNSKAFQPYDETSAAEVLSFLFKTALPKISAVVSTQKVPAKKCAGEAFLAALTRTAEELRGALAQKDHNVVNNRTGILWLMLMYPVLFQDDGSWELSLKNPPDKHLWG